MKEQIPENMIFAERLSKLRMEKGVSARNMSLSLGQSEGYINAIENGKTLPSMTQFLYICEYLDITPSDFFDYETENPKAADKIMAKLKRLNTHQLQAIMTVTDEFLAQT